MLALVQHRIVFVSLHILAILLLSLLLEHVGITSRAHSLKVIGHEATLAECARRFHLLDASNRWRQEGQSLTGLEGLKVLLCESHSFAWILRADWQGGHRILVQCLDIVTFGEDVEIKAFFRDEALLLLFFLGFLHDSLDACIFFATL